MDHVERVVIRQADQVEILGENEDDEHEDRPRHLALAQLQRHEIPVSRGLGLQPVVSGLVAVEYLWTENLSFTAHFDYYSSPFYGTGTQVLDKGVTESVLGVSYRILPALLWQLYGVENLDFITGSAADFTLSTVLTYRFRS